MGFDRGLVDWVIEAMEPVGPVSMRHMMGTGTLYFDGRIFAIVDESEIWLKSDKESDAVWDAAGCDRFTFTEKSGETVGHVPVVIDNQNNAPRLHRVTVSAAAGNTAATINVEHCEFLGVQRKPEGI